MFKGSIRAEVEAANFPSARYCVITANMAPQVTVITKKRKGPAPTGKGKMIGLRLQPDLLAAVDDWIRAQRPEVSRPEAIRRILADALKGRGS